jgi:predicted DNA-binding transcriptional regulator AlpA
MSDLLYVKDIADKLGTTEAAVRSRVQRRDGSIPPFFWLGRRVVWRTETVDQWLKDQEARALSDRVVRVSPRVLRRSDGNNA